ncbi:MAG TPA: hypothetical protein VI757_02355 [Bacteroidia bacterium]|nr:hypothetical protein [Bacteroidia bacterium]
MLQETGGSTGVGLKIFLKMVEKDNSPPRSIYTDVTDSFWMNYRYENKWLIGTDTDRLHELDSQYIVVVERENQNY